MLRVRDDPHDGGEHRLRARSLDQHVQHARPVDRAPDHAVVGGLEHRKRLTRHDRFVDCRAAAQHQAVSWHLRPWEHLDHVPLAKLRERNLRELARAVPTAGDAQRRRGLQPQQLGDG